MAAAGYDGTELGDWGFLPTDPRALAAEVERRALALVGAFVPIALAREDALDEGVERAVRTAQLLRRRRGTARRSSCFRTTTQRSRTAPLAPGASVPRTA